MDEVQSVIRSVPGVTSETQNEMKADFVKLGWEKDKQVLPDWPGRYNYDAYKKKAAVETELTEHSRTFKDCVKFMIGAAISDVDVGVLIVPSKRRKDGDRPHWKLVCQDLERIHTFLKPPIAAYQVPWDP